MRRWAHQAQNALSTSFQPAVTVARGSTFTIIIFTCAFVASAGFSAQAGRHLAREGSSAAHSTSAPSKSVVIDKTGQLLRAYEGNRLVFRCRVSTGRRGSTPNGQFYVQGKERMHYSSRYHNAPMPYSIHLSGHYFIHGYSIVPYYPASHGCIRVPLKNGNPAKRLYEWIEIGTPVIILGRWRR